MYLTEKLAVNAGDLAPGAAVNFDLPIKGRWVKFCNVKIVQLKSAANMHIIVEAWMTTAARAAPGTRTNFVRKPYSRNITVAAGGEYSEILAGNPVHYEDMDADTEDHQRYIHIRLENQPDGTGSDFDVSLVVADPYEATI